MSAIGSSDRDVPGVGHRASDGRRVAGSAAARTYLWRLEVLKVGNFIRR